MNEHRRLTTRELELLDLAAHGLNNYEIAAQLHISHHTVHNHFTRIREALAANSRCHAVGIAYRAGLLTADRRTA